LVHWYKNVVDFFMGNIKILQGNFATKKGRIGLGNTIVISDSDHLSFVFSDISEQWF